MSPFLFCVVADLTLRNAQNLAARKIFLRIFAKNAHRCAQKQIPQKKFSVVSLLGCQNKIAAASATPWGASHDDLALTR